VFECAHSAYAAQAIQIAWCGIPHLMLAPGINRRPHPRSSRPEYPAGRQQVLASPFEAGATHVAGNYGLANGNFLVEGAKSVRQLGSPSIFIYYLSYLSPEFRALYPDRGDHLWPDQNPASLVQLAQTVRFKPS